MKFVDDRPDTKKAVKHEIPQMPEGYYSGDKPNPNLKKFVEDHIREHPYDPTTDDYNVPAFDIQITTTKVTSITTSIAMTQNLTMQSANISDTSRKKATLCSILSVVWVSLRFNGRSSACN